MQLQSFLKDKLKFLIPGLLFYMTLNLFFKSFGFSLSAVLLLLLISATSAFWIAHHKTLAIIPSILLSSGSMTLLLTIGQGSLQKYFIVFVSVLFIATMIGISRFFTPTEERPDNQRTPLLDSGFNLNQTIIMFSVFFLSAGIYGIYIITDMRPWQMMLTIFAGIYLSSYYLIKINFIKSQEMELHLDYHKNRTFNLYSFLLALLMIELVWVMAFLPINHLTFGAIILTIFFSYWNIIRNHLRNELTRKKLAGNILFFVLAVSIIILTSRLYIN